MTPIVAGTREDVAGFALLGIDGVVCTTREQVEQILSSAEDDALVIVSATVAPERTHGRALMLVLPSARGEKVVEGFVRGGA